MAIFKKGEVINYLTIVSLSHIDERGRKFYNVKCKCGVKKVLNGALIKSGNTKSCGCYGKEQRKAKRISEHHCEVSAIIFQYKRHAKSRGFTFDLSRDFVESIVSKNCYYCGVEPSNFMKTKNSIVGLPFNGIDRVDSTKDYKDNNVVPCCRMCNNAKSNYTVSQFKKWALRLSAMANQWG